MYARKSVNRKRLATAVSASSQTEAHHGETLYDNNHPIYKRRMRLLCRRYSLTPTGYKYLEIGINVGPPSYVEIALGDNKGHELILSLETWKHLLDQRNTIHQCMQSSSGTSPLPICIGPLTIRFPNFNDTRLIHLESSNVRILMTEATLQFMCRLDSCVDIWFDYCIHFTDEIDTKFNHYSNIMSNVKGSVDKKINAICDSNHFQRDQLVDCELLALLPH